MAKIASGMLAKLEGNPVLDHINYNLTKRNPMEWPRDPQPAPTPSPLTSVYRVGDADPFFQFCAAPRIFGRVLMLNWSEKQRLIAAHFQCAPHDVKSVELDDGIEAIVINGETVGSFDVAIIPALGE